MPAVKKQKVNKSKKIVKKQEKKAKTPNELVVSGQLQKKIDKVRKPQKDPKGIVFIKHLPHGFFEDQLKNYFNQFGTVTRVRLARSRRTGNSKRYAFVEFEYPEVAEVAAETMNNYLMFKQIVKASYIPPEKQQLNYFRTSLKQIKNKSGKMVWVSKKTASIQNKMKKYNDWSDEKYQKRTQRQLAKLKKLGEKFAQCGINVNELILAPKTVTENGKSQEEELKRNELKQLEILKQKTSKGEDSSNKKPSLKKSKDKKVTLADLLNCTIPEDSEDEDYVAAIDNDDKSEESEDSSDEETYGFIKDSEEEEINSEDDEHSCVMSNSEDEEQHDEESAEETSPIVKITSKNTIKKVSKFSRIDKVLKRKPHIGGVIKLNNKPPKQEASVANKKKKSLQTIAAKELAKPLSNVKGKISIKNVNSKKNSKKSK